MDFLEKLGKSITDAGKGVSQSAKSRAEISKLNSAVSDNKRRVAACYAALGESYYKRHRDDADVEEPVIVQEITKLLGEISGFEGEIKRLRGIGKCPECGADVPEDAAFCSKCGAKLPKEEKPAASLCPNCGKPVKEGNKFCAFCGSPMTAPKSSETGSDTAPQDNEEPGEEEDVGNAAE